MNAKIISIRKSEGHTFRCLGTSGQAGIRMDVVLEIDGQRNHARLDYALRKRLGWLYGEVQAAIRETAPESVEVSMRNYHVLVDFFETKPLPQAVIRKRDLDAWAERAKAQLVTSVGVNLQKSAVLPA